jgi:hypothetical protein
MKALLLVFISPFAILAFHALLVRIMAWRRSKMSNQAVAVLAVALFNVPLFIVALCVIGPDFVALLYLLVAVNSVGYSYFTLFNMSETARRIKVLLGIRSQRVKRLSDLSQYYSTEQALEVRLQRLEKISQITRMENGNYMIRNRLMYCVSYLIPAFRTLLGFTNEGDGV